MSTKIYLRNGGRELHAHLSRTIPGRRALHTTTLGNMEGREEGNAVVEVKKHVTLEELCMQREGEPAPSSRLVDEDTHKILSRRRGKKKQHNSNKKEEEEYSKRESADEEFTSTAAAQTTHADVVEENEATPPPRYAETQSLPMDAVTVRI
jgi:hypothetical protein